MSCLICNGWSGGINTGFTAFSRAWKWAAHSVSKMPRFPTDDPDYRIIRRIRSRYLHYYFYVRDPVIGPLSICIGTYLPFQTTYYLNGHNFIEIELRRQGALLFARTTTRSPSTSDPKVLQAAADSLERVHHRKAPELFDLAKGS